MGEKNGLIFSTAIFFMFIVPLILDIFLINVRTSQFQKTTAEISEMVEEHGGMTPELYETAGSMSIGKDPLIVNGGSSEEALKPGDIITVEYSYTFDAFAFGGTRTLEYEDDIVIKKR